MAPAEGLRDANRPTPMLDVGGTKADDILAKHKNGHVLAALITMF